MSQMLTSLRGTSCLLLALATATFGQDIAQKALDQAWADSENWNRFRGPNGSGMASAFQPPVNIAADRAVWKTPLPPGKSSPILWKDRIFLTGLEGSRCVTLALDTATGKLVWETPRPYNRGVWSTPIIWSHPSGADLVVPGNGRVYGYNPATGEERWYVSGFAREPISVPVADPQHLFVSVSMQGGRGDVELDPEPFWTAMLQFDRNGDGRIEREEITEHFTLPFRPELPPGHPGFGLPLPSDPVRRQESQHKIFDWRDKNKDGFWTKVEFTGDMTVGRGRPNLAAIRPGGLGDITESHVSWNLHRGIPEIPSPILHGGRLYLVRDGGILSCVKAASGEVMYRERLGAAGQYEASPVVAHDHVYLMSSRGVLTVVPCGDQFKIVHQADLQASVAATPAMDRNTLYVQPKISCWPFGDPAEAVTQLSRNGETV